jgi:hypothetical protein
VGGDIKVISASGGFTKEWGDTNRQEKSTTSSFGTNVNIGEISSTGGFSGTSETVSSMYSYGHSENDTEDTRKTDIISDSRMNTATSVNNWSFSAADSLGNSKRYTKGNTQGYTESNTFQQDYTNTEDRATNIGVTISNSTSQSLSVLQSKSFTLLPGRIFVGIILQSVISTQVQFLCKEDGNTKNLYRWE